jgi:hypothetical protein
VVADRVHSWDCLDSKLLASRATVGLKFRLPNNVNYSCKLGYLCCIRRSGSFKIHTHPLFSKTNPSRVSVENTRCLPCTLSTTSGCTNCGDIAASLRSALPLTGNRQSSVALWQRPTSRQSPTPFPRFAFHESGATNTLGSFSLQSQHHQSQQWLDINIRRNIS